MSNSVSARFDLTWRSAGYLVFFKAFEVVVMTMVDVTITVDRTESTEDAVVSAVERAGFTVDRIFPEIRAIYGHGPAERMDTVRSIAGVSAVRLSGSFQLPPMNPHIPQ